MKLFQDFIFSVFSVNTYYGVQLDEVISTADMQPGVYYLVLSTEEGKSTKPFIVKR